MRIPQMAIPLTPVKGADSMSLLEANHHRYFKEGMKHVAHRGGGPFGSIGYDQAKADDLERLHGAVPTSRPDPVIMAEVSAGSSNALKRVLKKRYLVPLMASEASVPLTLTRDVRINAVHLRTLSASVLHISPLTRLHEDLLRVVELLPAGE
eukprot:GHVU01050271.1.p1 GENE.GHVU01050271.1~~GHVU01050271.1.p1  ORF type:complete len:152 (-),score=12.17 GHVU01050271.1:1165-1620(-)